MRPLVCVIILLLCNYAAAAVSPESYIESKDVKDVDFKNVPASGAGTLDALMFASSSSDNSGGGINLDDSNSGWPSGRDTTFEGSTWTTSFGELRSFYDTNFVSQGISKSDITVVLFFDISEKQSDKGITIEEIDIFTNVQFPTNDPRNNPSGLDITSDQQEESTPTDTPAGSIDLSYLQQNNDDYLKSLRSPKLIGLDAAGAGIPDVAVVTGIDPYDTRYSDNDTFTIWNKSSGFSGSPDEMFFSGDYLMSDVNHGVPLPDYFYVVLFIMMALMIYRAGSLYKEDTSLRFPSF